MEAETEGRRFEPVSRFCNLEGEVLAVLLVNWDVVVGVAEIDAHRPELVCQSLPDDVRGVRLELFDA